MSPYSWRMTSSMRTAVTRDMMVTRYPAPETATSNIRSMPSTPAIAWRCSGTSSGSRSRSRSRPSSGATCSRGCSGTRRRTCPGALDRAGVRHGGVPVRRLAVPPGCVARAARPAAGDDDADRARDLGGVRVQRRRDARAIPGCRSGRSWPRWSRSCCWATGSRCARSPRRRARCASWRSCCRTPRFAIVQRRTSDRGGAGRALRAGRPGAGAARARAFRPTAWSREGAERGQRVDDHRRVAAGRRRRRATR